MALTGDPATMSRYSLAVGIPDQGTLTAHDRDRRCAVLSDITVCQRRVSIAVVSGDGPPPLSPPRNR